jgi:hypothetical protein
MLLDLHVPVIHHFGMGSPDQKKLFSAQPSDLKMWQNSRRCGVLPSCNCVKQKGRSRLGFHTERQDINCDAWKMLNELIDTAASRSSKEFSPGLEMPVEFWSQIITLPPSISKLKSVRKLCLYGSFLVRVPPEIGNLEKLEELDLYTSYRLHWLPYEVTRCSKLQRSRFSTRALYGNYMYRPPFPQLNRGTPVTNTLATRCSVCGKEINPTMVTQVWISLLIATDVLPLLVNACSSQCMDRLPPPAFGYVDRPHSGGLELTQPPTAFAPPRPE